MRKTKIEALNDDGDPPRGDREVGIALIELGAIKKGKRLGVMNGLPARIRTGDPRLRRPMLLSS